MGRAEQSAQLDRGRHFGFARFNVLRGGPGKLAVSLAAEASDIRKHTLYAYAEGNDLHDVADTLDAAFARLIGEGEWTCGQPWAVNQRRDDDPSLGPDDLPDWEIGLNLPLPDSGAEPSGWFADVERIVNALEQMHAETGRDFVLGIGHEGRGISEDVAFIGEQPLDRAWLRRAFGAL